MNNPPKTVADLAIFGGMPAFSEKLHVGRPNIGDKKRILELIGEALDRRWLTNNGPLNQELEARLAEYLGVRHCICMCNATIALEIASRALGLTGEVIMPSFTFVATAHALQWQQITPIFCDIDPQTHNIDPAKVEALITPHTSGILGVHAWGRPCEIEQLQAIAKKHSLKLMFDAAHALSCSYHDTMIGNFSDLEVLSFHATKFFNAFEGGAVVTNDDELAKKVLLMRNFGFSGMDNVISIGLNGKMNEASAAMGLASFEKLSEFIETNRQNYQMYHDYLDGLPGLRLISYDETQRNNYQYLIVEVDEALAGISRDQLMEMLWAENVMARRYFYPGVHQMEPYRSYYPNAGLVLPETNKLTTRVMSLPTGTAVGKEQIKTICSMFELVIKESAQFQLGWKRNCSQLDPAPKLPLPNK